MIWNVAQKVKSYEYEFYMIKVYVTQFNRQVVRD